MGNFNPNYFDRKAGSLERAVLDAINGVQSQIQEAKVEMDLENDDKNLIISVAYQHYDIRKNLIRLDDLVVNSINCIKKESSENTGEIIFEKKIINKTVDIFLNKKIKLDQLNFDKLNCSSVTILDNKFKKTYIVQIDKLNSL